MKITRMHTKKLEEFITRAEDEWFAKPENARRKYVLVLDVERFHEFAFNAMLGKEI